MSSAATKSPKRRAESQRQIAGASVSDLILRAASASTERGGTSLAVLIRALRAGGYDVEGNRARIVNAIKRLVANKALVQTKGTGASGSFGVNKKSPAPRKKKPKAKEMKRVGKAGGDITPAAKKAPERRKRKSPRKAKVPTAAKKPMKVKRAVTTSMRTRSASKK